METFNKGALTAEEQITLLIKQRGLVVNDKESAINLISRIGYYHLSSYMRNFQTGDKHLFLPKTEFGDIINLYNFDNELRQLVFNAIEKIEIAYKAAISNVMCKRFNSHWFYNSEVFIDKLVLNKECGSMETEQEQILRLIQNEIKKKKTKANDYAETFIGKYYEKYNEPELPPFWMVVETFTIGSLNRVYYSLKDEYKRQITKYLGFDVDATFVALYSNWLQPICMVRNICAHHSRLYNRVFKIKAKCHKQILEFSNVNNNCFYYVAMIIDYYLKTMSNDSSFETNLINLFSRYPNVNKEKLGFPKSWSKFSITRLSKHEKKKAPTNA